MTFPEKYRMISPLDKSLNCFLIPFRGRNLRIIASIHEHGWEHVSVSLENRNPNWDEMCFVKNLFWTPEDECIQFHPREKDYINLHPYCLHIWKPPFEMPKI